MSNPLNIPNEFLKRYAAALRMEPDSRTTDLANGIAARTADPLWYLTRQWQLSEFEGDYPVLKETVNFINAIPLARSRGIQIKQTKANGDAEFNNLVSVTIKTDKETRSAAATLSPKREPRIVKIDDFYVEASPSGYLLVMKNWDVPGIIGSVGTLMGKNKINIAAMVFGRKEVGGVAVSILNVDSPISPELLEKIKSLENILAVRLVKL